MEYHIYCDESDKKGKHFSNFYGAALVKGPDKEDIEHTLRMVFQENNLFNELKWQKVTENYLSKYLAVMDKFFDLIVKNKVKIRILFTQNGYSQLG
ncbi:hypothetical protein [Adhaeribacter arboris]|uniref:hypothetical protein n=1 Tax=Adhaeribacter arboris TaxID=2072846 RepID=UPI0018EBBD7F|nr:hypothetical protein [Adhaeribacter arboris]